MWLVGTEYDMNSVFCDSTCKTSLSWTCLL